MSSSWTPGGIPPSKRRRSTAPTASDRASACSSTACSCRDTVEEKVAALQETKRDLAASIIAADGSLLQKLDRETLEMLLA